MFIAVEVLQEHKTWLDGHKIISRLHDLIKKTQLRSNIINLFNFYYKKQLNFYLKSPMFLAATTWFSLMSIWCSIYKEILEFKYLIQNAIFNLKPWNLIETRWFIFKYFSKQFIEQLSSLANIFRDEKSFMQSLKHISTILLYCLANSLIFLLI